MDRPRHPQVIRPWKTQKTKKINGAYRPRQHGATAPGSFSALSAADRLPRFFRTLRFSFWFCDHPPRTSSFDAGKKLAEFLECLGTNCGMHLKKRNARQRSTSVAT